MKTRAISTFAVLAILLSVFVSRAQDENKYDLKVISDVETYNSQVAENPSRALVDLTKHIPGIALDIRYATKNNFMDEQIYDRPAAFARKPVAAALVQVQAELATMGLALKVFDAYRPYAATVKFYEVYPDKAFVAAPWKGSVHNRGCAVDVGLIDLRTKKPLQMPTPFDSFSEKAAHTYSDLPEESLRNRKTLKDVMTRHGFSPYDAEWWHYDFKGWKDYDLMNISFADLIGG